jgi:type VI secretion system secreted protein VgrG
MIRQQELRVDRQTATAQGSVRSLSAGSLFKLTRHHRSGVDAQYAVTGMNLTVEAAPVESGKGGGGDFVIRAQFAVLNTSIPFRLKRVSPKPIIAGVQTAVVVGPKNEEIHTDDMGRIRVKFRWDRTGKEKADKSEGEEKAAPEDSSCWIRVAQPWASSGFGFQFIPRVGDEVIVQFLEGDPDRPLVTGSVYNSVNKFPFTLPGKKTQSGVKTRSSKKGGEDNANIIRLEDDKGHEEFFVQAEKNHTVTVKADRSVSVGGNETYGVTGTRDTTITKKNTDTYKDEHEMTVTKKVTEVFLDEHSLAVQKKQTIEVQNNKSEYVDQGYELTTKGKFLLTQGGAPNAGTTMKFEGDAVDMDIKGPLTITRGVAKISIDPAGNVAIESALSITLSSGTGSVTLGPEGATIKGMMVNLNA